MAPWEPPRPLALTSVTLHPEFAGVIQITDAEGFTWCARHMDNGTLDLGRVFTESWQSDAPNSRRQVVHFFVPLAPHGVPTVLKVEAMDPL